MRALALLLALSLPVRAVGQGLDDDLEEEHATRSFVLALPEAGGMNFGLDVGWLRSGVQANLGVTSWLEFLIRFEALALYDGLGGQNTFRVGARAASGGEFFRYGLELGGGRVIITPGDGTVWLTEVRGELTAGILVHPRLMPYARLSARGLDSDSGLSKRWAWENEAGLGLETGLLRSGQLILGAEVYSWSHSGASTQPQWRLRVAYTH